MDLYVNLTTGQEFRQDPYEALWAGPPQGFQRLADIPKEELWNELRRRITGDKHGSKVSAT